MKEYGTIWWFNPEFKKKPQENTVLQVMYLP